MLPSDALVVKQVLESMGIKEYEPRVVHQLLDFMYRNVAEVLQVAEAFSNRAGSAKKEVGMEDVMLAIQAKATTSFVAPPAQDALQAMADRRNKIALPALATKYGFRLPPPEDCLIAPNFQFHPQKPAADMDWEESNISTGTGTEPVTAPPSRSYRTFKDVQARHPAFAEAPEASSAPSVADTGQPVDRGITDMQS
ncbi:hypothetical protein ABBQ38_014951 [Trebouxia sp. C0009 RCD-2024]